jgi:hypothetical protein
LSKRAEVKGELKKQMVIDVKVLVPARELPVGAGPDDLSWKKRLLRRGLTRGKVPGTAFLSQVQ